MVGGGDSAFEEALFLTKFASRVHLVHRRDEFRASRIMVDRAEQNEKLDFVLNAVVEEIIGDAKVEGLRLRSTATDETWEVPADGLFVAIGHDPNTSLFVDQLDHDENGYLVTQARLDRDEHPRRLRRRRRAGPHLPAGGHRRRIGLHGRARRRAVPRDARGAPRHRDDREPLVQPLRARSLGGVAERPEWIDLIDPSRQSCSDKLPERRARDGAPGPARTPRARRRAAPANRVARRLHPGDLPLPIAVPDEDRVYYQEIDFVATRRRLRHGLEDAAGRAGVRPEAREGSLPCARGGRDVRLPPRRSIAERFLDLVDDLDDEIDELEDLVGPAPVQKVGTTTARPSPGRARDPPHAHSDPRCGTQDRRRPRRARRRRALSPRRRDRIRRRLRQAAARDGRHSSRRATRSAACATSCRARSRTTRTR